MDDFPNLFDADDFHGLVVHAPRGVRFPNFYEPRPPLAGHENPPKHGACLFLTDLPPELWGQVNAKTSDFDPDWVYVSAYGNRRPEVVPYFVHRDSPVDASARTAETELLSRLGRLGARNLSHDKLFIETPLRLEVGGYRWGSSLHRPPRLMPDSVRRALEGKFLLSVERVHIELKEGE